MKSEKHFTIDSQQVSHNDFGDEVVVIHFETGNYYSLRGAAAVLWNGLASGRGSAASLLDAFDSPPTSAEGQIGEFLEDLARRSLLVEAAAGASLTPPPAASKSAYAAPELEAFEDLQALLVADVIHDTNEQGWPNVVVDDAA